MKKRKSPILLITLLVALGGAAVIMNLPRYESDTPPLDTQQTLGAARESDNKDAIAKQQADIAKKQPGAVVRQKAPVAETPLIVAEPSIKGRGGTAVIDNATPSMWYLPEHGVKKGQ